MKNEISRLFRQGTCDSGFLLISIFVLCLTMLLPALCVAIDASESKTVGSSNSASPAETGTQISPRSTEPNGQKLNGGQRLQQERIPTGNRIPYPIVTSESDRAIRSIKRSQTDFNRSMRDLNDSLRRANSAINRIRSLNRKF
jgi:hypothetical protein